MPSGLESTSDPIEYFRLEKEKFEWLAGRAALVSNAIGHELSDERRVMASWLFTRACVTAQSLVQLLDPPQNNFGKVRYLDHGSIAALSRCMLENTIVFLYVGDAEPSDDEWICRRYLIDLHDYHERTQFLRLLGTMDAPEEELKETLQMLQDRLRSNSHFKSLHQKQQKLLLEGKEMFIGGKSRIFATLGWSDDQRRGLYKYLSNQTHTGPMAFHRTVEQRLYDKDSQVPKGIAGIAISIARVCLGVSSLRMLSLFPSIEAAFEPSVLDSLQKDYQASKSMHRGRRV
jgi:hypothetical protein